MSREFQPARRQPRDARWHPHHLLLAVRGLVQTKSLSRVCFLDHHHRVRRVLLLLLVQVVLVLPVARWLS